MYIELYDRDLSHITNAEVISYETEERVYDPNVSKFKIYTLVNIEKAALYILKDPSQPTGATYHSGFVRNIQKLDDSIVDFKGEDLRKIRNIDVLLDWSNGTINLQLKGIFAKTSEAIMNSTDSMITNIPVYFNIPDDITDTTFIADYANKYLVVNAEKFEKPYLGYFNYFVKAIFNASLNRIEFIYEKQNGMIEINLKDFIHEKTTSDIKTNKVIATISFNTIDEIETEWLDSNITEYDEASSKSDLVGSGITPALPDPKVYENNHVLRRIQNKEYIPGNITWYNASEVKATRYVYPALINRTSCPSTPPSGTQVWDLLQTEPFDDKAYYRIGYKYIHSTTGETIYCSNWQYGKVGILGEVLYTKKTGSTYYPRPNLPEKVYTLGSDNQIYEGYAPSDKRIYPVQQKIFEADYLAQAQLNAVSELVNSRYVENIILTDDNTISPIPLSEFELNKLVRAYDSNGNYKDLPVSEKVTKYSAGGKVTSIKLGFKKTKLTEIIKNDLGIDEIVKNSSRSSGGSKVIELKTDPVHVGSIAPSENHFQIWIDINTATEEMVQYDGEFEEAQTLYERTDPTPNEPVDTDSTYDPFVPTAPIEDTTDVYELESTGYDADGNYIGN